nr:hypothetical protein [Tanacetum cinerariifolium]
MDVNTAHELEEVQVDDIEMDEDCGINRSHSEEKESEVTSTRIHVVKENMDVNTAHELEEVQVDDIEMDEDCGINRSHSEEKESEVTSTRIHVQNRYANVAWLIARWMKRKGAVYCRYLDMSTLRELIDSESRLILEDLQLGVPRVGIPRPSRASMQDLYDRMCRIEIRQEAIERMEYRQSYH